MKPTGKFVRDPVNYSLQEREQQLNATRGPSFTFHCKKCRQRKSIYGRRKVGREWVYGTCVSEEKEKENV